VLYFVQRHLGCTLTVLRLNVKRTITPVFCVTSVTPLLTIGAPTIVSVPAANEKLVVDAVRQILLGGGKRHRPLGRKRGFETHDIRIAERDV
jgi:hypothetical protein